MKQKKVLPPTYFWVSAVVMIGINFLFPIARIAKMPYNFLGVALLLIGLAMNIWSSNYFEKVQTTIKPFQESSPLVIDGLFKISRNPMYLGMVIALFGLFIILGNLSPIFVIPVYIWLMNKKFIEVEENDLEEKFGETYREYKKEVRRWI